MVNVYEFKSRTSPRTIYVIANTEKQAMRKVVNKSHHFKYYQTKPAPHLVKKWYTIKVLGVVLV